MINSEFSKDETKEQVIVPLSAKEPELLKLQAKSLYQHLKWEMSHSSKDYTLSNIAYTLQVGREQFDERVAFVVASMEQLLENLEVFYESKNLTENIYVGSLSNGKKTSKVTLDGESGDSFLQLLLKNQEAEKLAALWVGGINIDWKLLYKNIKLKRIPLSTYTFAKERYWLIDSTLVRKSNRNSISTVGTKNMLHSLIDENISKFGRFTFKKKFWQKEFFISGHNFGGKYIAPGAVHLEMAHAAYNLLCDGNFFTKTMKDIVFGYPIECGDQGMEVSIDLNPDSDGTAYEIYSTGKDGNTAIHSKGIVEHLNLIMPERIELSQIKARMTQDINPEYFYNGSEKIGAKWSGAFRSIKEISVNDREALTKLSLEGAENETVQDFVLHPALIDGAMQTVAAWLNREEVEIIRTGVLFYIGQMDIYKPLEATSYVHIIRSDDKNTMEINLYDEEGGPFVQIKGMKYKEVNLKQSGQGIVTFKEQEEDGIEEIIYTSRYTATEQEIVPLKKTGILVCFNREKEEIYNSVADRIIMVRRGGGYQKQNSNAYELNETAYEDYEKLASELADLNEPVLYVIHDWSKIPEGDGEVADTEEYLDKGVRSILLLSKALANTKYKNKIKLLYLNRKEDGFSSPLNSMVGGFMKTQAQENPNFYFKMVSLDNEQGDENEFLRLIRKELNCADAHEVNYNGNNREIKTITHVRKNTQVKNYFVKNGVYLITGGMGGLGLQVTEYLAKEYEATIILSGRSALSGEKNKELQRLNKFGGKVYYIEGDVSNRLAFKTELNKVRKQAGSINGVIHSAGIIEDGYIVGKTMESFNRVLKPKVEGTMVLDEITKEDNLHFFMLFSSITAVLGNEGQCDYAAANAFMDDFVLNRAKLVEKGERSGHSLSINWSLWINGGMKLSEKYIKNLKEMKRLIPLTDEKGMEALCKSAGVPGHNMIVYDGDLEYYMQSIQTQVWEAESESQGSQINSGNIKAGDTKEAITKFLTEVISKETKFPVKRIKPDMEFEKFGIDSLMIMNLTARIEKIFGKVPKTLFFEYTSINRLAEFFIKEFPNKLAEVLGTGKIADTPIQGVKEIEDIAKQKGKIIPSIRIAEPIKRESISEITDSLMDVYSSLTEAEGLRGELLKQARKSMVSSVKAEIYTDNIDKKNNENKNKDIAIVGLAGRYPRAENVSEFWNNLKEGKDCVTEVPKNRWNHEVYYDIEPGKKGKTYSKWGGFIDDVEKFDPMFFNISPREANVLDPHERVFLEMAWKVVEDAGYTPEKLNEQYNGNIGVFVGATWPDYQLYLTDGEDTSEEYHPEIHLFNIPNRVSYQLGFNGPSIAVDTACSSALSAIHMAVQNIRSGNCKAAIAGGVNLTLHVNKYINLAQRKFLSTDGRCRSFGKNGNGYVPGEGVGAILLKNLEDAVRDKDTIYGVIKGTAVNHGGKANGYTVPSPNAQAELIGVALKDAGFGAESISYVEAHGTGTSLGDPIEIRGLVKAFATDKVNKQYCAVGSSKSNIGHLEAAAGIAQLTKVLLQMKYNTLVPSIHAEELNPDIDFKNSPFYVQRQLEPWRRIETESNGETVQYPRRSGISSFGAGGSNAHIIIEQYEPDLLEVNRTSQSNQERLVVLSADSREVLNKYARDLIGHLEDTGEIYNIRDIAYTLQTGRVALKERFAASVSSVAELKQSLEHFLYAGTETGTIRISGEQNKKNMQEFTSQELNLALANRDTQVLANYYIHQMDIDWEKMYEEENVYHVSLPTYPFERESYWIRKGLADTSGKTGIEAKLHPMVDRNCSTLYSCIFEKRLSKEDFFIRDHRINEKYILPGVAYLEMARAVAELANSDDRVVGFENISWMAPVQVGNSGNTIQICLETKESSVLYKIKDVKRDGIKYSQGGIIYSGNRSYEQPESVNIARILKELGCHMSRETFYSYYERLGLDYGETFKAVQNITYNQLVTVGELKLSDESVSEKFVLHPGLFDSALQIIAATEEESGVSMPYLPYSMGRLHIYSKLPNHCYSIVRKIPNENEQIKKYDVNIYDNMGNCIIEIKDFIVCKVSEDFARDENQIDKRSRNDNIRPNLFFGQKENRKNSFKMKVQSQDFFMRDHLVGGVPVLPAVVYLEMARNVAEGIFETEVTKISNVTWSSPVEIKGESKDVRITADELPDGRVEFRLLSLNDRDEEVINSSGKITFGVYSDKGKKAINLQQLRGQITKSKPPMELYCQLDELGLKLGGDMQSMQELYVGEGEAFSHLKLPDHLAADNSFTLHPSLMANALGTEIAMYPEEQQNDLYLPFSIDSVEIFNKIPDECYVYAFKHPSASEDIRKGEIYILDKDGVIVAQIVKIYNRKIDPELIGMKKKKESSIMYFSSDWIKEDLQVSNEMVSSLLVFERQQQECSIKDNRDIRVIRVTGGNEYAVIDNNSYIINYSEQGDYYKLFKALIEKGESINNILYWAGYQDKEINLSDEEILKEELKYGIHAIFYLSKAIIQLNIRSRVKLVYVQYETDGQIQPQQSAVNGFMNSFKIEKPNVNFTLIRTDETNENQSLVTGRILQEYTASIMKSEVKYSNGQRHVKKINELKTVEADNMRLKENGVYVISGGTGGLGIIFAKEIAAKNKVKIALLGRSEYCESKENQLEEIKKLGSEAIYVKVDITDLKELKRGISEVKSQFGAINGVIHSAGVIKDSYLKDKAPEDFLSVLEPKVMGTVNLDSLTKNEPLDFFLLFSSATAVWGNLGQTDYSTANSFMDSYSVYRRQLVKQGLRTGSTVSYGWPLWEEGGMKVDKASLEMMNKVSGMSMMSTENGINAFFNWIGGQQSHVLVMNGEREKVRKYLMVEQLEKIELKEEALYVESSNKEVFVNNGNLKNNLTDKIIADLSSIVVQITGVKREKIDPDMDINKFGFDSVMMTDFGNEINKKYGVEITPAIFFEYNTISTISVYLTEEYIDKMENFYLLKTGEVTSARQTQKQAVQRKKVEIIELDNLAKKEEPIISITNRYEDDIAIIGAAGIFPGANDLSEYWEVLRCGKNCISKIPKDRFDWEKYYNEKPSLEGNDINTKWGGFIEHIDTFDAGFMCISPQEAELMDPQQRKLLETVWHTLEDAGYNPHEVAGTNTGVFVGVEGIDYTAIDMVQGAVSSANPYSSTGIGLSLVANRISYVYDFHGPSEVLSTACSSSLTSVDAAIKSIWNGDCDMALAGGVSALLSPYFYMLLSKLGVLSPDGECRTFDKDANGYVRSEGVGTVLLKPFSKAIKDKDNIYAVIKGMAVNHGGKANSITSPNVARQVELIEKAYKRANISPDTVTYIETHGTGTRLGDPVEINGLKKGFDNLYSYFGKKREKSNYCGLGSVKTNIGHLEPAASVASIIKVILSMRNGMLPGTVHFKELNPYIQIKDSPFYVVEKTKEWIRLKDESGNEIPRRAGISGFGYGGAYAHIVLEEYRQDRQREQEENEEIFVFSAKDENRLNDYMRKMLIYLDSRGCGASQQTAGKEKLQTLLLERMNHILSEVTSLPIDIIDEKMDVFEQGVDIYAWNQFLESMNTEWEIAVKLSELDSQPTLEKLSQYISSSYYMELAKRFGVAEEREISENWSIRQDMTSFAYTLQVGRAAFESRIAILAANQDELRDKIRELLEGNIKSEGVYISNTASGNGNLRKWLVGEPGEAFLNSLINENDRSKIADLWVNGLNIDWGKLRRNNSPVRISLPGYEFAKDRYWINVKKYSLEELSDDRFNVKAELDISKKETINKNIEEKETIIKNTASRNIKNKQTEKPKNVTNGLKKQVSYMETKVSKADEKQDTKLAAELTFVEKIQEYLVTTIQKLLKIHNNIDIMKDFNDLGLDSITMNSLLVHFQEKLDISISPLTLLEFSTLEALSAKLEEDYQQEFKNYFDSMNI